MGYKQSTVDQCMYLKEDSIILVYVDDMLILSKEANLYEKLLEELKVRKFEVSDEGNLEEYLGVEFRRVEGNKISMSQPQVIQSILLDLGYIEGTKTKSTPAISSELLHKDPDGKVGTKEWNYRSVCGKLNYLEASSRPDLAFAVHQVSRFMESPRESHIAAVNRIGRYLAGTKERGLIFNPEEIGFEVWTDADWIGSWKAPDNDYNATTAKSRSGAIIMFAGCPIIWSSKLQSEIALSSTEAEYIALSSVMKEVIPLLDICEELKESRLLELTLTPTVKCTVFEDNVGAIEIAKVPKMRPRTKYTNAKYHHFRRWVALGKVVLQYVPSKEQLADVLTKPLPEEEFVKLRQKIMGW